MFKVSVRGGDKFLRRYSKINNQSIEEELDRIAQLGVTALANKTPKDTGRTASSWKYRLVRTFRGYKIEWYNTNQNGTANVALLIQYGHGTRGGTWVNGRDYINPAMESLRSQAADIPRKVLRNG